MSISELTRFFSGEYKTIAAAAVRLIERVEDEFSFDSGVRRVVVLPWTGGLYFSRPWVLIGNTIKVHAAGPRTFELRGFVYHELGHAICDHFDVAQYLKPFVRRFQSCFSDYRAASNRAAEAERRSGFVSGYASCNREEDFCETLAAYLLNRSTWRRSVSFECEVINSRADGKLRAKLDAVHELLRDLHTFV